MKVTSVLFAVLLMYGNCLAGNDTANSTAGVTEQHFSRHIKKAVRTDGKLDPTDIKPITPAAGITTGFVLVYGHFVQPPYQVRVENNKVLLNGVPVGPGITEKDILAGRANELRKKANQIFCDGNGKRSPGVLAAEILALFENSPDTVINAKWNKIEPPPNGVLLVYWKGNLELPDLQFNPAACVIQRRLSGVEATRDINKRNHEMDGYSRSFQKSLEEGKLLFFGSDGSIVNLPSDEIGKLKEAINDETLERKELIEKLKKMSFTRHSAQEIIRNYEPK